MLAKTGGGSDRYQEVVDRAGIDDFYGRMAQLGMSKREPRRRSTDKAIKRQRRRW